MHPDPLGSPDVLTDEAGQVLERRSYAPFGAARNADWRSVEAPGPEGTNLGFTGHEDDRELGLVNMGGRVYDPKLARFLQPDALVQAPGFSLSWNPYGYAFHSPLRYTDPSGWQVEGSQGDLTESRTTPDRMISDEEAAAEERYKAAADAPPDWTVVGPWANGTETTGPAPQGAQPHAAPVVPAGQPAWSLSTPQGGSPAAAMGFAVGVVSGLVPGGALANALGMTAVPPNDAGYEFGNGLGQIVGGLLAVGGGTLGEIGGVTVSATGIGAAVGVPAVVAGAAAQANGATAIVAGAAQLLDALNSNHSFSTGSGAGVPSGPKEGAAGLPDLSSRTPAEAREALVKAGFEGKKVSEGGWQRWRHPNGSEVNVNWNTGRVVRTAAPERGPDGRTIINRGQRLAPDGESIPLDLPHDQHPKEFLRIP